MESRVPRFNRTQRTLHWVHALSFLVLVGTGLAIYLPALASAVGHRAMLRQLHLWLAIIYFLGPVLTARLGNWKSIGDEVKEIDQQEPADFQWLRRFGRQADPPLEIGRFNAGQKLSAIFTGATILLFGVSGLIMWQGHRFPQWLTQNALLLHDGLTWAALGVWLGHLYFSLLHPTTRGSLRGMIFGWVNAEWARKHHTGWFNRLNQDNPALHKKSF